MYKCDDCGAIFEEPSTWLEDRGECWGTRAYETLSGCPECGEPYSEAYECEECGEWFTDEELDNALCEKCRTRRCD